MRSNAQKEADKKYWKKNKEKYVKFSTTFTTEELAEINKVLKNHKISKAEFIRKAIEALKKGCIV